MDDQFRRDFLDLNRYGGLGDDPVYHAPVVKDDLRAWPLDRWADAPRDLGYDDLYRCNWKGVRLLKYPPTQAAYHDLLWELRPRTIIELGVYAGGSLVWFRDLARLMGLDCQVIGVDRNLSLCQIPADEMSDITLLEGDCTAPATLEPLRTAAHPLVMIDDAHFDTFNIMKWAVGSLLEQGDYFIIEDMIPTWRRYTPGLLSEYLAAFREVLAMDVLYSNACPQLEGGVFRRL